MRRLISVMLRNLEISAGLMDFKKNVSFYLFLQKLPICGRSFISYSSRSYTGFGFSLKPLASMWARYLPSLDRRATASLMLKLKCFIMTSISSYRRDLAVFGSPRESILLISTSTMLKQRVPSSRLRSC